jgi:hypothetical protein
MPTPVVCINCGETFWRVVPEGGRLSAMLCQDCLDGAHGDARGLLARNVHTPWVPTKEESDRARDEG